MKKIKILFAINCMNIGGAPSVVFNQMRLLDRKRYDPYLLTLYPSKPANFLCELSTFLPPDHQKHVQLKNRSIFDFRTLFSLYKYLREEQFTIVYTHLFLANFLIRILAILVRTPIILAFEHSTYFNKSRWQVWADRILSRYTSRILVSTQAVADFTKEQLDIPGERFAVVRNPVTIPERAKVKLPELRALAGLPKDAKNIFVTVGRFSPEKGQEVLLRAIHANASTFRKLLAHFIIVGHGPEEVLLREFIDRHKIADITHLLHAPERAKEFLFLADWFVLPSLREGQAIVVEEAMLSGLPVVASSLQGMGDIVKAGYNGKTFHPGDWLDLAHLLPAVPLRGTPEYRKYRANAESTAKELFSPEVRVKQFEDICATRLVEKHLI